MMSGVPTCPFAFENCVFCKVFYNRVLIHLATYM